MNINNVKCFSELIMPYFKKKILKLFKDEKYHPDVVLICDDGYTVANKIFLVAQSKVGISIVHCKVFVTNYLW